MKAVLLCRPGDFGLLEEVWPHHPLTLPVLGVALFRQLSRYLVSQGVHEVRVLQGGDGTLGQQVLELERLTKAGVDGVDWSFRAWHQGPFPQGKSLPEVLQAQRLFQDDDDLLVLSAPILPLSFLTGPKVPPLFPVSTSRLLAPRLLTREGLLAQHDVGPCASLCGAQEYHRTQLRLLATVPPPPASLRGVHRSAVLEAPLLLGQDCRVAARAVVGPSCVVAPRTRIEAGARLASTLVLSPVRIGKDAQFDGKILIGTTVVNPADGTVLTVDDARVLRD